MLQRVFHRAGGNVEGPEQERLDQEGQHEGDGQDRDDLLAATPGSRRAPPARSSRAVAAACRARASAAPGRRPAPGTPPVGAPRGRRRRPPVLAGPGSPGTLCSMGGPVIRAHGYSELDGNGAERGPRRDGCAPAARPSAQRPADDLARWRPARRRAHPAATGNQRRRSGGHPSATICHPAEPRRRTSYSLGASPGYR